MQKGWRFFPIPSSKHLPVLADTNLFQAATNNLQQLRRWARVRSNWALVTGRASGVFVLEVDGEAGLASLLDLCNDDWSWLDTLRSAAGGKRCISFAWPNNRRQIGGSRQIAKGLRFLGEGDGSSSRPLASPMVHSTRT